MEFHNEPLKRMKLCLVGGHDVGKTSIVQRFATGIFQDKYKATVSASFTSKSVNIDGEMIEYRIWDTAGQEKYRSMMQSHYRGSAAAIVVYDIACYNSFQYMKSWVKEVTEHEPNAKLVVLGNKCDQKEQRQVPYVDGKSYADRNEAMFMETSAKTGENIEEMFYEIGRALKSELSQERRSTVQLVDTQKSHKRRRPCCKS